MKDIDQGWAWVVLTASFAAYFISCGLFYNIGIYFVSFLDAFDESRSYTAWVGALLASMFHVAGPLSSLILPYLGARGIWLLGGCFMGFSYAILYFSQSILYIAVFYGLFGGIGCFLVVSGCLTAVANYFRRRLYLATGLMSAGAGLGTVTVGVLTETLIEAYGWRGSLLLMSGLALQACVCASLVFRQRLPGRSPPEGAKDFRFLTDIRFWWLSASAACMSFSSFSLYVFLKDVMLSKRLASDYRMFVVWLGLGSAAGRVTGGLVASRTDPLLYYFGVGLVCTADVFLMAWAGDRWTFYGLGCLFGACHGNFCALQPIKISHIYGRERMAVVWGFTMSLGSVGVLAGPPVGGFIVDRTGSYDGTLALYAVSILVSSLCSLAAYFWHRRATSEKGQRSAMDDDPKLGTAEALRTMLPKPVAVTNAGGHGEVNGETDHCPSAPSCRGGAVRK